GRRSTLDNYLVPVWLVLNDVRLNVSSRDLRKSSAYSTKPNIRVSILRQYHNPCIVVRTICLKMAAIIFIQSIVIGGASGVAFRVADHLLGFNTRGYAVAH